MLEEMFNPDTLEEFPEFKVLKENVSQVKVQTLTRILQNPQ